MPKPGTYLGIVKDNTDKTGNGRIRVYIPEIGGDPTLETSWYVVSYMSPHAGQTNPYSNAKGGKNEDQSQDSYGSWNNGYHLENEVMVSFLDDNATGGVVMGGLFQQNMNHSMGGYGFSKTTEGEFEPTVEYNKRDEDINPRSPERPRNERLWRQLNQQGLIGDPLRTTMNSSPARDLVPQIISMKSARGSSFVFDDGKMDSSSGAGVNSRVYARQPEGGTALIQMRTEGGAQTIINDDCGFIHMTSGNGNSTMQLSDNGVTYFSEGHIAVRVGGNFTRVVDGNVTMETLGPTAYSVAGHVVYAVNGTFSVNDSGPGIVKQTDATYTTKSATYSVVHDAGGALSYKAATIIKQAAAINKNTTGSMAPTVHQPMQKSNVMSVETEAAPAPNTPVNEPVIRQAATTEETTLPPDGLATHDPAPANAQTCGGAADAAEQTENPESTGEKGQFTEPFQGVSADKMNEVNNMLIDMDYTKEQRAAILGSFVTESGLNPTIKGDGGRAFGLAQWHPDRQQGLMKYASANGLNYRDLGTQVKFFNAETTKGSGFGTEWKAGNTLRGATTVDQAMRGMKQYERYGIAGSRYTNAQRLNGILR